MAVIRLENLNDDEPLPHEFTCSEEDARWLAEIFEMLSTAVEWEIEVAD